MVLVIWLLVRTVADPGMRLTDELAAFLGAAFFAVLRAVVFLAVFLAAFLAAFFAVFFRVAIVANPFFVGDGRAMGDRSVDLHSVGEKKYRFNKQVGKWFWRKTLEKSAFYGKHCRKRKSHMRRDPS